MKITHFLFFILILASFCGCRSKIVVKQLENVRAGQPVKKEIANGSIYALPNTVVRVQLKINKETTEGAPYSTFASIFVPGADVVCQNRSSAQLIADVKLKTKKDENADAAAIKSAPDPSAREDAEKQEAEHQKANGDALEDAKAKAASADKGNNQTIEYLLDRQKTQALEDDQAIIDAQATGDNQKIADARTRKAAHSVVIAQALQDARDRAQSHAQAVKDALADPEKFNLAQSKIKSNPPVCGNDKFSVQQGATFATYGEPDPENVFLVKWVGRGAIDQNLSMTWNEAGVATAASSTVTNRTGDVILSTAKMVASLGTKAALGSLTVTTDGDRNCLDREGDPVFDPEHDWIFHKLEDAHLGDETFKTLAGNYCGMSKEDREKLPQNNAANVSLFGVALSTYLSVIAPLEEGKGKIFGGNGLSDSVDLLSRIETELTAQSSAFFTGIKKTISWDGLLDLRSLPTASVLNLGAQDIPLLYLNPSKGFCLGNGEKPAESKPYPADLKKNLLTGNDCSDHSTAFPVNLKIDYFPKADRQLFSRVQDIEDKEKSFRYRVPAQVRVDLNFRSDTYGSGIFYVGQLGTILSLPATRHSKQLTYDLAFFEQTGGLKTFKLGTVGILDTSTIDALSGVGGTLIDARNKSADDLNNLTRQYQLLKLQDDICTIQRKYGITCTVPLQ